VRKREKENSVSEQLHRNVQRFRVRLVFKPHRLCLSLNSRRESNKDEEKNSFSKRWPRVTRRSRRGTRCTLSLSLSRSLYLELDSVREREREREREYHLPRELATLFQYLKGSGGLYATNLEVDGTDPRGEKMLYPGTDSESYITEYTLVYEDQWIIPPFSSMHALRDPAGLLFFFFFTLKPLLLYYSEQMSK